MTHVLVLSAKVRRIEHLWQTLDIDNMFESTFGFKNSQEFHSKEKDYQIFCSPLDFYLPTWEKIDRLRFLQT